MSMRFVKHLMIAAAVFLLATSASATDVTFNLRDQNGVPIPASAFVTAGGLVANGGTVTLAEGLQDVDVFPGIDGLQTQTLSRTETIDVSGAAQTVELTWKLAPVEVTIVDQNGVPIPASETNLHHDNASVAVIDNGEAIDLPVTFDPDEAPINGVDGYLPRLFPGTNGFRSQVVHREEAVASLTAAGLDLTFTWRLAPLAVTLVDSLAVPITGSQIAVRALGANLGVIANGGSLVLPVTSDPGFPPVLGASSYDVRLFPGTDGATTLVLFRDETTAPLAPAGASEVFEWIVASGPLFVVDAGESAVAADLSDPFVFPVAITGGTAVSLPITDAAVYPTLGGLYAGGYQLTLDLGATGSFAGPFTFLADGTVTPLFVDVGGSDFGLRLASDRDGDGILDVDDNCPDDFNPDQSDIDFDGLGDVCDDEFTEETVVEEIEIAIEISVELIEIADPPGANGLINKLIGNNGVLPQLEDAIADFLATGDVAAFIDELEDALAKCEAFRNQLDAKIANGQIDPETGAQLEELADLICGSIQVLIDNVS